MDNSAIKTQKFRHQLPVTMPHNDYNIWSVLKNCIGKELSKITMPVVFNEPLSFLQRIAEYMEYAYLLRIASQQDDPVLRMQYVCAFAISSLASNWERLGKPFNPLLGETYELKRKEFRIVCEQVSHHPPISAFYADSENWTFHGSIHPKLKFWGKSVEIQPKGTITVTFPKLMETYTWNNIQCYVHNIIVGKLWMEQCGNMEIINHTTGHSASLAFKSAGWNSKDLHTFEGFITDKSKNKHMYLYGKWTEFVRSVRYEFYEEYLKERPHKYDTHPSFKVTISCQNQHTSSKNVLQKFNSSLKSSSAVKFSTANHELVETCSTMSTDSSDTAVHQLSTSLLEKNAVLVWKVQPRPKDSGKYYQFTDFAMSLNQFEDGMESNLCPTDSRLRPDIRKLEEGDIDGAASEKTRLEEKQRISNKSHRNHKGSTNWTPRYFMQTVNTYINQDDWRYQGNYWNRESGNNNDLDIF